MTIEHAIARSLQKPWGVVDSRPWSSVGGDDDAIGAVGEIWYERSGQASVAPSLLLKLLLTSGPLSIQVHPGDAYAHSIGLPSGKTEAWHVLSAEPEAKIAVGLKRRLTRLKLRQAVDDGSIADLVLWRGVSAGDTVFVPAGTIHAIGAGLVIAEIQQRSDATFRMFDHGRGRALHVDEAIAVADLGPADFRVKPSRLTDSRTLLASNNYFTFEKIELEPHSAWHLETDREAWLLVVSGGARIGSFEVALGDAVFADSDRVDICAGVFGLSGLLAYTGGPVSELLLRADMKAAS